MLLSGIVDLFTVHNGGDDVSLPDLLDVVMEEVTVEHTLWKGSGLRHKDAVSDTE